MSDWEKQVIADAKRGNTSSQKSAPKPGGSDSMTDWEKQVIAEAKNQKSAPQPAVWRYVCAMNDYSINSHLIPNSEEPSENGTHTIRWSCQIYHFLENVQIGQESEIAWETSCMHCRFYNEHLIHAYDVINQGYLNLSQPLQVVKVSIELVNSIIQLFNTYKVNALFLCHPRCSLNNSVIPQFYVLF